MREVFKVGKTEVRQEFRRRTPREEFLSYTEQELRRLRSSDVEFDEALYTRAMDLVLERLQGE